MADYTMSRGDSFVLAIQVQKLGVPQDITLGKLWFTAKYTYVDPDIRAVSQLTSPASGVVFTFPTAGKAVATMPPTATMNFPDGPVKLVYDVQYKDSFGIVSTVDTGTITVYPDVTRTTA